MKYKVGDEIRVNLHAGKIVEATIRAVIQEADGIRLQIDFGFYQTALIYEWQVVKACGICQSLRRGLDERRT